MSLFPVERRTALRRCAHVRRLRWHRSPACARFSGRRVLDREMRRAQTCAPSVLSDPERDVFMRREWNDCSMNSKPGFAYGGWNCAQATAILLAGMFGVVADETLVETRCPPCGLRMGSLLSVANNVSSGSEKSAMNDRPERARLEGKRARRHFNIL